MSPYRLWGRDARGRTLGKVLIPLLGVDGVRALVEGPRPDLGIRRGHAYHIRVLGLNPIKPNTYHNV